MTAIDDDSPALDIVTSEQIPSLFGIKPGTLRQWVFRGDLKPLNPGHRPLRFQYDDVARVQRDKRPPNWRQRHRDAIARWVRACDDEAV